VWELTLACNSRCVHCGSTAGQPRANELSSTEALALIAELATLGCQSVTLSGGEPLLRRDWPTLAAAIGAAGMSLDIVTNGLVTADQADAVARAEFRCVSLSVDGPAEVHDALRGIPGGLQRLLVGAERLRAKGVRLGAVTQVNRRNLPRLADIYRLLTEHGFEGWQVQLTLPHGRARDRGAELCLAPEQLPGLEEQLVKLRARSNLFMQAADNLGYMSRYEPQLRTGTGQPARFWTGCAAGLQVVGITSDGTVRGCLSLPPADDEGNIRARSLSEIWRDPNAFAYNRQFTTANLVGACARCPFGRVCRGGCRSLTRAISEGSTQAGPYCSWYVTHGSQPGRKAGGP
jgi:radical SAM protein with 4Fe4S-binding SPASM domain